ncbi:CRISPR-associated endonuclease Cas2 [Parasutterella secunda]|mgnify:CR=1 FL=1|uniref:CRISPR-associated endonuclease Cas2 n=1 Tax=Parasutterella secunda TaxID=626947 RepID=UPI0021ACB2DE|nr:CRISPR-associated endonuclease Cas2 [Parasutterella secunda]MCR8920083.1 CRISPR-associated endonuclease Cas2 [Parasutterella secunda]
MVIQMGMFGKYIVCYDVEDNKRRSKFFDFLKDIGLFPVQKSVFYGDLNAAELRSLKTAARKMLKSETDSCIWVACSLEPNEFKQFIGYKDFEYVEADGHDTL